MKKKSGRRRKLPVTPAVDESGKVRFEVRMEGELHGRLRQNAEALGVSVNRLLVELVAVCVDNLHLGRAVRRDGMVAAEDVQGFAFIGEVGREIEDVDVGDDGRPFARMVKHPGRRCFDLNFTGRAGSLSPDE